jgi:general stress protein 26
MAFELIKTCRVALLTTADKNAWPHATWMNFHPKGYLDEIYTITAPTTLKVANLRENPRAEWLFSDWAMETVVTVAGPTRVIEGDEVKEYWDVTPGKAHAFYRHYAETDDFRDFVVISTKVEKVFLSRPSLYRKYEIQHEPAVL